MDAYQETFETWNKVAQLYQDKFMDLTIYDDTYDRFCDEIPEQNAAILEIGCGPGNITQYLLKKRPDFKITGIDIAPNMVALAKANNPAARFSVMDVRKIDGITTQFEGIVCGFCVPYLSETDCEKLILDCCHLLTKNGILYLSFVEGDHTNSGFLASSTGDRTYFYYHHLETFHAELRKNGFEPIQLFHKNYSKNDGSQEIHTIVLAKKSN